MGVGLGGRGSRSDAESETVVGLVGKVLSKDGEGHDQAVVITGGNRDYSDSSLEGKEGFDALALHSHPVGQRESQVADQTQVTHHERDAVTLFYSLVSHSGDSVETRPLGEQEEGVDE